MKTNNRSIHKLKTNPVFFLKRKRAVWVEITNEYVEIMFKEGGMSEEDIKAIINNYAPEGSYTIEKFEDNEGKTTAIIKFVDSSTIEGFSRKVIVSERDFIDCIKYNSKSTISLAGGLVYPFSFFYICFSILIIY